MPHRLFRSTIAFAATLVALSAASVSLAARQDAATLYVNYTNDCTFTITTDSGAPVGTIAPGTYQVQVSTPQVFADVWETGDPGDEYCGGEVQFSMTGPGLSYSTTLQEGDEDFASFSATLAPSSTYVAVDNTQPTVARVSFTTAATGTPTTPASPSGSASGSSSGGSSVTSSGGASSALGTPIASTTAPVALVGTLTGTVSARGKLSLTFKGKPVATLTAGRYTIVVTDNSKTSGFIIQQTAHPAITISHAGARGKHTATVTLTAGQWLFYPSVVGAKSYFVVVS